VGRHKRNRHYGRRLPVPDTMRRATTTQFTLCTGELRVVQCVCGSHNCRWLGYSSGLVRGLHDRTWRKGQ
jgi:hypothetical protein